MRASRAGTLAAALAAAAALSGCGGLFTAQGDAGPPLPTPQISLSPDLATSVGAVRGALASLGVTAAAPAVAYRPSEPASMLQLPRAVLQSSINEPEQGYVIIYQLPDATAADTTARELAAYLGSGFGQTNFPLDAQFHVSTLGDTVVFTWWSAERSSDRAQTGAAFDAVSSVGTEVPVLK